MALLQYTLKYDEDTDESIVTCQVLEVDPNDKIQFKSTYASAGIKYKGGSPFTAANAPKANIAFKVGRATKPFVVAKKIGVKDKIKFDCGKIVPPPKGTVADPKISPVLKKLGTGHVTPPGGL